MNYADAKRRLEGMVAASTDPVLSPDELADLLFDARRPDRLGVEPDEYLAWQASMALSVGATVTPSVRNGHYYTVTASDGQAGATEPTWPTTSGATVTADGVTYQESGAASWEGWYDLNAAAAEGWDMKAGKCSDRVNSSADGASYSEHQTPQFCQERAAFYRSRVVQSAPLRGRYDRKVA